MMIDLHPPITKPSLQAILIGQYIKRDVNVVA